MFQLLNLMEICTLTSTIYFVQAFVCREKYNQAIHHKSYRGLLIASYHLLTAAQLQPDYHQYSIMRTFVHSTH